jgi:hypothetical protein
MSKLKILKKLMILTIIVCFLFTFTVLTTGCEISGLEINGDTDDDMSRTEDDMDEEDETDDDDMNNDGNNNDDEEKD